MVVPSVWLQVWDCISRQYQLSGLTKMVTYATVVDAADCLRSAAVSEDGAENAVQPQDARVAAVVGAAGWAGCLVGDND
jgi:hypothetical protein